jgi:plasmid stabilization system protein ParE
MARRLVIEPGARQDLADAFRWYEERRRGLGRQFLAIADTAFLSVADFPLSRPLIFDALRRVNFPRFPYAAFYFFDERADRPHVLAVLHQHRVTPERLREFL